MAHDPADLLTANEPILSLNFDDGHDCLIKIAEPIMRERGLRGTFFTPVEAVRQSGVNPGNLSVDDMARLVALGHEVGSHALHHRELAIVDPAEALEEIRESIAWLVARGIPVTSFAYPLASVNQALEEMVSRFYRSGRTTTAEYVVNRRPFPRYHLQSFRIEFPHHTVPMVKACIDRAIADKVWLILLFHHVHSQAVDYLDYASGDFAALCDHIVSSGVTCATNGQVMGASA